MKIALVGAAGFVGCAIQNIPKFFCSHYLNRMFLGS